MSTLKCAAINEFVNWLRTTCVHFLRLCQWEFFLVSRVRSCRDACYFAFSLSLMLWSFDVSRHPLWFSGQHQISSLLMLSSFPLNPPNSSFTLQSPPPSPSSCPPQVWQSSVSGSFYFRLIFPTYIFSEASFCLLSVWVHVRQQWKQQHENTAGHFSVMAAARDTRMPTFAFFGDLHCLMLHIRGCFCRLNSEVALSCCNILNPKYKV